MLNQLRKRLFFLVLIGTLVVQACAAPATTSQPDPTSVTEATRQSTSAPANTPKPNLTPTIEYFNPTEGVTFPDDQSYIIGGKLDPNMIPEPAEASTTSVEQTNAETGETSTKEANLAVSTSDSNGITAFNDMRLELTVPIVVVDEQGQPIEGIDVDYISTGDFILVIASDPLDRFAPTTVTLSASELAATAKSMYKTVSAREAFGPLLVIAAAVILLLKIVDAASDAQAVAELAVDPLQLIKTLGKPYQICASPEQLGKLAGLTVSFIPLGDEIVLTVKGVVITASKFFGEQLVEWGVATGLRDPILWDYFSPTGEITNRLLFRNKRDPNSFQGFWRPIGKCGYVPNVIGKTKEEAEALLSAEHLEFYVTEATKEGVYAAGFVEEQQPGSTHHAPIFGKEVETMLPQFPTSNAGRVHLVISIGQPATEPAVQVPEPTTSLRGNVTQQSSCRYGPSQYHLYKTSFKPQAPVKIIGRDADGDWLQIELGGGNTPCWMNASLVQVEGDVMALPDTYPIDRRLPISDAFPQIALISASPSADGITASWVHHEIREDLKQTDAVEYVIEVWTCVDGKPAFYAVGTNDIFASFQIDNTCGIASHAHLIGQDEHGFSFPTNIPLP